MGGLFVVVLGVNRARLSLLLFLHIMQCNIGVRHRIARGVTGFVINALVIFFQASLPVWLFWLGIVVSYAVIFQGVVGVCYFYALLGMKEMK